VTRTATSKSGTASSRRRHRASVRTSLDPEAIADALIENLHCLQAKRPEYATRNDWYMALAYTVRDRALDRYIATLEPITVVGHAVKVVAYFSAEFLTGPHLGNNLINLGIWDAAEQALAKVGQSLSSVLEQEEEPGLGNGGLARNAERARDRLRPAL
jgi:glycogen phosphorylase